MNAPLFHYTCDHGLSLIRSSDWTLLPQAGFFGHLIWMTDLSEPDKFALGLTSVILSCDRTAHRLRVLGGGPVWWPTWCRAMSISRSLRDVVELAPGARPMNWWVASDPVACELAVER